LAGRLPGIRVQNTGGTPGAESSVDIRGFGKPLILVDGVEHGSIYHIWIACEVLPADRSVVCDLRFPFCTFFGRTPGAESSVDIRGFGKPLILVDGVEQPGFQVDPNEIESISVLNIWIACEVLPADRSVVCDLRFPFCTFFGRDQYDTIK